MWPPFSPHGAAIARAMTLVACLQSPDTRLASAMRTGYMRAIGRCLPPARRYKWENVYIHARLKPRAAPTVPSTREKRSRHRLDPVNPHATILPPTARCYGLKCSTLADMLAQTRSASVAAQARPPASAGRHDCRHCRKPPLQLAVYPRQSPRCDSCLTDSAKRCTH
jgi:hypothetical protein